MYEFKCLTNSMAMSMQCDPNDCEPREIEPCGPDYGTDCMPDCDPADDY